MRLRSLLVVSLAASIALPAPASNLKDLSNLSLGASVVAILVPFSIAYVSGAKMSEASKASFNPAQRWQVVAMRANGPKTELELHDADGEVKLTVTVDTRTARSQDIKPGDELLVEEIGKAGYALKKDRTTVAVLAQSEAGMVHSKARR